MRGAKNCPIPVAHHHVFPISKTVRACLCIKRPLLVQSIVHESDMLTCSQALLAFLQLLEKPKISGDFGGHRKRKIRSNQVCTDNINGREQLVGYKRLRKNTDYRLNAGRGALKAVSFSFVGTPRDDNDHMIAITALA